MTFPVSPANNETATVNGITYVYSSATNSWARTTATSLTLAANLTANKLFTTTGLFWSGNGVAFSSGGGGGSSSTYTSDTVPPTTGNIIGDQWYDTTTDTLFEYINDGTTSYWIDVQSPITYGAITSTLQGNLTITGNFFVSSSSTISGNLLTSGDVTVIGNISSANITTGDIAAGNLSTSGNLAFTDVAGGNITTSSGTYSWYFKDNGDLMLPPNSLGGGIVTAPADTRIAIVTDVAGTTAGYNELVLHPSSGVGVSSGAWIYTNNELYGWQFQTDGNLAAPGSITATGIITATGEIGTTSNIYSANIVTGHISSTGTITTTSNISSANVTSGNISVTRTITAAGNIAAANIITGNVTASVTVRAANLVTTNGVFWANGVSTLYGNTQVAQYLPTFTGTLTPSLITNSGNLTVAGNVVQQGAYYETFGNITNVGGNLTCNFNNGTIFNVTAITANVTANFTNVNAISNGATGAVVLITQSATAYRIANVQINGVNTAIRWVNATSAPLGNANNIDIVSFSIMYLGGGTYSVFGQLNYFG